MTKDVLVSAELAKEKLARGLIENLRGISSKDLDDEILEWIRNTDLTDCQQVSLAEIPACDCYCSPHLRNCATQQKAKSDE